MRRITILVLAITVIFLILSYAHSSELIVLSQKASKLEMGMSRKAVLDLLGRPTWAVIPGDKGDWELLDSRTGLELHWKYPGCSPLVVEFNKSLIVTGWDEGCAFSGKDAPLYNPSDQYSCSKSDRAKYCK